MRTTPKKPPHPSWVHAETSHWLHEAFIFKTVCHHFWPGLMAGTQKLWDYSVVDVN
jgi:hypothetical protein